MNDVMPDFAAVAALIGDPARSRMLSALMGGVALTATELAGHAAVSPSTASTHLAKLVEGRVLDVVRQGRHRYFRIADPDVAALLESLIGVAARNGVHRGPAEPSLAAARVCYDHLAGEAGVWMTDRLQERGFLTGDGELSVSPAGERFFRDWGLDFDALVRSRRPLCRSCLDWSERRIHLGGALGAAILQRLFALRWVRREPGSRAVTFSAAGERAFHRFPGEHALQLVEKTAK